jgi:hydrogenase maturation protease
MKGRTSTGTESTPALACPTSVLVLGLGNPILGDDGVGWKVAMEVAAQISASTQLADVEFASVGGLGLMERMLGYDQVILIDSIDTGSSPEGAVYVFKLEDLPNPSLGHTASAHDSSLVTALQAARQLNADVPGRVDIVAVETHPSLDFSEELSPAIAAAVPSATRKVLELLKVASG